MLKTLLYYWYERDDFPYVNPPHYYFNFSQDTSQACQTYIRILFEWKRQIAQSLPQDQFCTFLRQSRVFFKMNKISRFSLTRDIYEEEDHGDFIKYVEAKITPSRILLIWHYEFWKRGWNLLEYIFITLTYTDEFFTEEMVLDNIPYMEREAGVKKNALLKEWNFLKKTGMTKIPYDTGETEKC